MATPKRRNPKKAGRKTKFRPEYVDQAKQLIADGKNQKQCQDFFNVSRPTWSAWKKAHPEFLYALQESLAGNIAKVEDALLKRALGYEYLEIIKTIEVSENDKKKQTKKEVMKHISGNVEAMKLYLYNRCPDRFKPESALSKQVMVVVPDDVVYGFKSRLVEMEKQDA
jgi:type I restriction-modification system DNA methylase subunit